MVVTDYTGKHTDSFGFYIYLDFAIYCMVKLYCKKHYPFMMMVWLRNVVNI